MSDQVQNEIRHRRQRLGLTQRALAQRAGFSQMQVSRIERNATLSGQSVKDVIALLLKLESKSQE